VPLHILLFFPGLQNRFSLLQAYHLVFRQTTKQNYKNFNKSNGIIEFMKRFKKTYSISPEENQEVDIINNQKSYPLEFLNILIYICMFLS
jgi:hypothetical protein